MNTIVSQRNSDTLSLSSKLIQDGQIISFPTETIYGLFGDALNANAVQKIFEAKGRPSDNPLIVHLASYDDIEKYAFVDHSIESLLIQKFMPGPFTLVLKKKSIVPDCTTGGLDTVCIRIPDHAIARDIISSSGCALAGPSANRSGRPSPITSDMVYHDMQGRIPLVINGGRTLYGIESTVVKFDAEQFDIKILRPGFITKEDIEYVVPPQYTVSYADEGSNESPGTRYRHYSPHASVDIIDTLDDVVSGLSTETLSYGLLITQEFFDSHRDVIEELKQHYMLDIIILGSQNRILECAQNLYESYALCDRKGINSILIQSFHPVGIGYALMNRIKKSAGML